MTGTTQKYERERTEEQSKSFPRRVLVVDVEGATILRYRFADGRTVRYGFGCFEWISQRRCTSSVPRMPRTGLFAAPSAVGCLKPPVHSPLSWSPSTQSQASPISACSKYSISGSVTRSAISELHSSRALSDDGIAVDVLTVSEPEPEVVVDRFHVRVRNRWHRHEQANGSVLSDTLLDLVENLFELVLREHFPNFVPQNVLAAAGQLLVHLYVFFNRKLDITYWPFSDR